MDEASVARIISMYQSGSSGTNIAKLYQVKGGTIYGILRRNGIKIRSKGGSEIIYDDGWSNEFVKLYKSGMSISKISKQLGVGFGSVQRALYKHNIQRRPNGSRVRTINMPTSVAKLAYMAGLLDGEGNIQIKKHKRENGRHSIACKLSIYNTNNDVMLWLQKNIGGHLRWDTKRQIDNGWKPIGIWELYRASDVYCFLTHVMRYLIIKRGHAKTVIAIFKRAGLIESPKNKQTY